MLYSTQGLIKEPIEVGKHLVADPRVCFGKLTFQGTRVPVNTVLALLAIGRSIDDILTSWPYLKRAAIEEAIRLAAVAWPELLKEQAGERIRQLAEGLSEARSEDGRVPDEPTDPGRERRSPTRTAAPSKKNHRSVHTKPATR
jgi:uncharacterized protein (DUF433 family)